MGYQFDQHKTTNNLRPEVLLISAAFSRPGDSPCSTAVLLVCCEPPKPSPPSGRYFVSWLGNSFSGAGNKWVQNHFIHMKAFGDYGGIASGKPGEVK